MKKSIRYTFENVDVCEMCGDDTRNHKIHGQRLNKSQGLHPRKKEGISVSVKKCANCGLIYPSPLPVPINIQDHYGIPPEDYWKPSYFQWNPDHFNHEINTFKRLYPNSKGAKVLDIGSGIGKGMLSFQHAGFDTYGFEPSEPFYQRAISKMNISPDRLKLGMVEEIEYDTNFFDFITFSAVLEHLYHPRQNLQKAISWLKPGGIIHMEVPSSKYLVARLINFYYWLIGTSFITNLSPMHEPFHLYEFDIRSFEAAAKKLNCRILFHEYYVGDIPFIPKALHPIFQKYMRMTNTGLQLAVWLQKLPNEV